MASPTDYVQFALTYTLLKTHVDQLKPLVFCKFLFSNHVNSALLSSVNLILY